MSCQYRQGPQQISQDVYTVQRRTLLFHRRGEIIQLNFAIYGKKPTNMIQGTIQEAYSYITFLVLGLEETTKHLY